MGIQIGARPDSGFDDPIGMLKDCHRRIEHFLHILCAVPERAQGRALNEEETAAVEASLHYFRVGGKRHNADEEESLFPRMRAQCGADEVERISGLEHDHQNADALHREVEELYAAWMSKGRLDEDEQRRILEATRRLKEIYAGHIELEESLVFPRAAEALTAEAKAEMGEEFRRRRQ